MQPVDAVRSLGQLRMLSTVPLSQTTPASSSLSEGAGCLQQGHVDSKTLHQQSTPIRICRGWQMAIKRLLLLLLLLLHSPKSNRQLKKTKGQSRINHSSNGAMTWDPLRPRSGCLLAVGLIKSVSAPNCFGSFSVNIS